MIPAALSLESAAPESHRVQVLSPIQSRRRRISTSFHRIFGGSLIKATFRDKELEDGDDDGVHGGHGGDVAERVHPAQGEAQKRQRVRLLHYQS